MSSAGISKEALAYTVVSDDYSPDNFSPCVQLELDPAIARDAKLLLSFLKSLWKIFPQHQRIEVRCPSLTRWPLRYHDSYILDELFESADIKRCEVVENSLIIKRPTGPHEGPAKAFEDEIIKHFEKASPKSFMAFVSVNRNEGTFHLLIQSIISLWRAHKDVGKQRDDDGDDDDGRREKRIPDGGVLTKAARGWAATVLLETIYSSPTLAEMQRKVAWYFDAAPEVFLNIFQHPPAFTHPELH